jgi:hypothetical protein
MWMFSETSVNLHILKHLSAQGSFTEFVWHIPVKNRLEKGDALSPLLFNIALEWAIRRVRVKQKGLKVNGTHQLLVYADDVSTLGGSVVLVL